MHVLSYGLIKKKSNNVSTPNLEITQVISLIPCAPFPYDMCYIHVLSTNKGKLHRKIGVPLKQRPRNG